MKTWTRFIAVALMLTLALTVMGPIAHAEGYEIALVTDVGNIDDQSFNQSAWEGVKEYAEKNNKTFAYYRPQEDTNLARKDQIVAAIDKGAKVVVLPGFLFADVAAESQKEFPEVTFIVLDTEPTGEISPNSYAIYYQEEQAGYLAGYAAVKEGYTKLGFLGGMAVPAVVRFGYGYVQGADAAAKELGTKVDVKYWYADSFAPSDDIKTKMSGWFTEGTQIVFACGGGIYNSAVAAADEAKGKVIGVDSDQAHVSPLILTSATKGLKVSVVDALAKYYDNGMKLPDALAGKAVTLGAKDDAVGLPTNPESFRFEKFTMDDYNKVFGSLKDGSVVVDNAIDKAPAVENATVDYQN